MSSADTAPPVNRHKFGVPAPTTLIRVVRCAGLVFSRHRTCLKNGAKPAETSPRVELGGDLHPLCLEFAPTSSQATAFQGRYICCSVT